MPGGLRTLSRQLRGGSAMRPRAPAPAPAPATTRPAPYLPSPDSLEERGLPDFRFIFIFLLFLSHPSLFLLIIPCLPPILSQPINGASHKVSGVLRTVSSAAFLVSFLPHPSSSSSISSLLLLLVFRLSHPLGRCCGKLQERRGGASCSPCS